VRETFAKAIALSAIWLAAISVAQNRDTLAAGQFIAAAIFWHSYKP
jgi:hypothetical protein